MPLTCSTTTSSSTYLLDPSNPTGYVQTLEQRSNGTLKKSYTLGLDVISQWNSDTTTTPQVITLAYDGHGSTRSAVGSAGAVQRYVYDAFGNLLAGTTLTSDLSDAWTTLLYSGEQTDSSTHLQYLRARYYDPRVGRFGSQDNLIFSAGDTGNANLYLYCNGDPGNGRDPSGHFTITQFAVTIGIVGLLASCFIPVSCIGNNRDYGIKKTTSPKRIAIITGDLGYAFNWRLSWSFTSVDGFVANSREAGHNVTVSNNPNEQQMISLLNNNDIVLVICHGNPSASLYDKNNKPYSQFELGGVGTSDNDAGVDGLDNADKERITANELYGKITNKNLILVTPSCYLGGTSRMADAINGRYFVCTEGGGGPATIEQSFNYISGFLNGSSIDALNEQWKKAGQYNVVNPTNKDYQN